MTEHEIKRFAKDYAIPLWLAQEVCQQGGNWAKAFDLLVARIKPQTQQETEHHAGERHHDR